MAFLAEIVFFGAYFVAWITNQLPHATWVTVTAIAAVVIAILLIVDNRGAYTRRVN